MGESSTKPLAEGREAGVLFAVGLPFAASYGPRHAGQGGGADAGGHAAPATPARVQVR